MQINMGVNLGLGALLQVECHPYFTQPKLLEYCRQNDIIIVGYSPLGTSRDASWYQNPSFILMIVMMMVALAGTSHFYLGVYLGDQWLVGFV